MINGDGKSGFTHEEWSRRGSYEQGRLRLRHDEHCGRSLSHLIFLTLHVSHAVTARLRGKDIVRNLAFWAGRSPNPDGDNSPMDPAKSREGEDIGVDIDAVARWRVVLPTISRDHPAGEFRGSEPS
jgi:hypothetical protein